MSINRKILWKCTTAGRIHVLEETLYSFINQDNLEDSEMIIVNDYPLQTLHYDHPNVKIFNIKEPFKTIGEKDNFCIEQSDAEIICVTDDDDTYLNNHNNNIRKYFVEGTTIGHWFGAYYNYPDITKLMGIGNSGMVYSREAWLKVGKHEAINEGGDTVFSNKLHELGNWIEMIPPLEEVSAFYRWSLPNNGGVYHQSGLGSFVEGRPNAIQRHAQHIEQLRRRGLIPTGDIELKPHWNQDYSKLLKDFINNKK